MGAHAAHHRPEPSGRRRSDLREVRRRALQQSQPEAHKSLRELRIARLLLRAIRQISPRSESLRTAMLLRQTANRLLPSALMFALALAAFCAALANLGEFANSAGALELAAALERGAMAEPGSLDRFVRDGADAGLVRACADAASRARLTLALAALRNADAARDISRKAPALRAGFEASEARLACSPLDGNAWLQWA